MAAPTLPKWRLNSPLIQNYIGGVVLALTPGIFTALGALGSGGGRASSTHLASIVNSVSHICLDANEQALKTLR